LPEAGGAKTIRYSTTVKKAWAAALQQSDLEVLRGLAVEQGIVDSLDRYGQTGLMLAARAGQNDVVRLLLELGANPDVTAKYNLSAMMLAVIGGHTEVVRLLHEAGSDQSILGSGAPGFDGKTALDLAEAAGRQDIINLLRH
jgi:ankyrin repeat protein